MEESITNASCGKKHCCLLSAKGSIYSFGSNHFGQTGLSKEKKIYTSPTKVVLKFEIIQVSRGSKHTICLDKKGEKLIGFGSNQKKQLGLKNKNVHFVSPSILVIPSYSLILRISAGNNASSFVTSTGEGNYFFFFNFF